MQSLSGILDYYPHEIRHIVNLAAAASLDIVDGFSNVVARPEQVSFFLLFFFFVGSPAISLGFTTFG